MKAWNTQLFLSWRTGQLLGIKQPPCVPGCAWRACGLAGAGRRRWWTWRPSSQRSRRALSTQHSLAQVGTRYFWMTSFWYSVVTVKSTDPSKYLKKARWGSAPTKVLEAQKIVSIWLPGCLCNVPLELSFLSFVMFGGELWHRKMTVICSMWHRDLLLSLHSWQC